MTVLYGFSPLVWTISFRSISFLISSVVISFEGSTGEAEIIVLYKWNEMKHKKDTKKCHMLYDLNIFLSFTFIFLYLKSYCKELRSLKDKSYSQPWINNFDLHSGVINFRKSNFLSNKKTRLFFFNFSTSCTVFD